MNFTNNDKETLWIKHIFEVEKLWQIRLQCKKTWFIHNVQNMADKNLWKYCKYFIQNYLFFNINTFLIFMYLFWIAAEILKTIKLRGILGFSSPSDIHIIHTLVIKTTRNIFRRGKCRMQTDCSKLFSISQGEWIWECVESWPTVTALISMEICFCINIVAQNISTIKMMQEFSQHQ